MQEILRLLERVAFSGATALILGESGTGKELVAQAIHRRGKRWRGPFVAVNCGAIPSTLVEAEFFGYEKGAFTDARELHLGKFEQAHGGTLLLDEVGDLPPAAQAILLRVLQNREVTRLGGRKPISVDVHVLAATNRNIVSAVDRGEFRNDLYWRLNVVTITLPPLRERREDIPLLVDSLIQRITHEMGIRIEAISPVVMRRLSAHDWPGNVRELENTLRRAVVLCDGVALSVDDLPPPLRGQKPRYDSSSQSYSKGGMLGRAVRCAAVSVERDLIIAALAEHRGNRTAAAKSLGINRKTLFKKMLLYAVV